MWHPSNKPSLRSTIQSIDQIIYPESFQYKDAVGPIDRYSQSHFNDKTVMIRIWTISYIVMISHIWCFWEISTNEYWSTSANDFVNTGILVINLFQPKSHYVDNTKVRKCEYFYIAELSFWWQIRVGWLNKCSLFRRIHHFQQYEYTDYQFNITLCMCHRS